MSLTLTAAAILGRLDPVHPMEPDVAARLEVWTETLTTWSRVQNLVGWRSSGALLDAGLLDCWHDVALLADIAADDPVVDVGSGAGLPGLVIAAAFPHRPVHLVEARRKRASFLREAARRMKLPHVVVHHGRSAAFHGSLSPAPAIFVSRAFAAPGLALVEADALGAQRAIVATSAQRLEDEPIWPPAGWIFDGGNSRRENGASRHDRLLRVG